MKKFAFAAVAATLLVCGGSAFAQPSGAMSGSAMNHDSMSQNAMGHQSMSKDAMGQDAIRNDSIGNHLKH